MFTEIFIRSANNYDRDQASDKAGLKCEDKSLTRQEFAEEVDINTIVHRFGLDGELPENLRMPQSGDFTNTPDFQTAMNALRNAQETFDALPARVRARFHNDPAEFVAFCDDKTNWPEAGKLGLLDPEKWATHQAQLALQSQTPATPPATTTGAPNGNPTTK